MQMWVVYLLECYVLRGSFLLENQDGREFRELRLRLRNVKKNYYLKGIDPTPPQINGLRLGPLVTALLTNIYLFK